MRKIYQIIWKAFWRKFQIWSWILKREQPLNLPARWSSWYLALARMTMHPLKMHSNSNFFVFFSAFNAIYSTQLLWRKMEADYVVSPIIIYLFILVVFKFFSRKNGSHRIRPGKFSTFYRHSMLSILLVVKRWLVGT